MKKQIFSFIATVVFSSFAFANTKEINENNFIETQEAVLTDSKENSEDDFWFCYEVSRDETYNYMTGETTVTITRRCSWYAL